MDKTLPASGLWGLEKRLLPHRLNSPQSGVASDLVGQRSGELHN